MQEPETAEPQPPAAPAGAKAFRTRCLPAVPDGSGIVCVRHELGTEDVEVECRGADGSLIGYLLSSPIDRDEVEVITIPGSGVATVCVRAADDGGPCRPPEKEAR